jgi:hypothetical protein
MRGLILPIVAIAVVLALLMCGTTATETPNIEYTIENNAACVESPAVQPALAPVVQDPGSCGDRSHEVACQLKELLPAARPRNILRQGVRLLTRLPCC